MLQQPYALKEIDEDNFNKKVDTMINAIRETKGIIWCDDTVEECTDECPLKLVCD